MKINTTKVIDSVTLDRKEAETFLLFLANSTIEDHEALLELAEQNMPEGEVAQWVDGLPFNANDAMAYDSYTDTLYANLREALGYEEV